MAQLRLKYLNARLLATLHYAVWKALLDQLLPVVFLGPRMNAALVPNPTVNSKLVRQIFAYMDSTVNCLSTHDFSL
jgi:hypothetical protein